MNTNEMLLQINGAIDWIRAVDAASRQIPAEYRNAIAGINWADDVVTRLEIVKAALQDQDG